LLTSPIFLVWARHRGDKAALIPPYVGGICLVLGINVLDLLPNATLTPITWLLAGALLGYAEKGVVQREAPKAAKMKLQSVM
jgi:hypothetical protein